jgi:hypothetical protein
VAVDTQRPWIGPLSTARPEVLRRLHEFPSFQTLVARGLELERTLLFVPKHKPTYDAEIFVLGTMFAWDEQSPVIWKLRAGARHE